MQSPCFQIVEVAVICCLALLLPIFGQEAPPEPTPQELDKLIKDLKSPSSRVRSSAAFALGKMGSAAASAAPALAAALKDINSGVRIFAAEALGKMGSAALPVVPAIVALLKDTEPSVRGSAAFALGRMGSLAASAVPALTATLKDRDSKVRRYAVEALGQMASVATSTVPALTELLTDTNRQVCASAVHVPGQMGSAAVAAAPALAAALKDNDIAIRLSGALALEKIAASIEEDVQRMPFTVVRQSFALWQDVHNNLEAMQDEDARYSTIVPRSKAAVHRLVNALQQEQQSRTRKGMKD